MYSHSEVVQAIKTNHHSVSIDHHLLKEFSKGVQELRDLPYDEKVFGKRLELLERQITGLLKRDFLIHGSGEDSKTWSSYYSTLN